MLKSGLGKGAKRHKEQGINEEQQQGICLSLISKSKFTRNMILIQNNASNGDFRAEGHHYRRLSQSAKTFIIYILSLKFAYPSLTKASLGQKERNINN